MATLEDGTPIEDVVSELREARAEIAQLKQTLRAIRNLCDAPHWSADRRWKVRDLATGKAKPHESA